FRAASRAASLTMFASSAPAKPGVRAAITASSTFGASTTARACNRRMASRPRMSGLSTTTWRSKRPGRSSAWSSTSGRLVAAMMMTPLEESKPSISARSWFSVCSRSSWPPTKPVAPARDLPMASSSSMKMMQGALSLACSKRSRTRAAPTPTNISTNSEPDSVKKGTSASPATARASSVLPVPGAHPAHEEHPDRDHDRERDDPAEEQILPEGRLDAARELHVVRPQLVDELLVVDQGNARRHEDPRLVLAAEQLAEPVAGGARRRGQSARLGDAADLALGDGHFLDLVGLEELEKLRHRDLDRPRRQQPALQERQNDDRHEQVGEGKLDALGHPRL